MGNTKLIVPTVTTEPAVADMQLNEMVFTNDTNELVQKIDATTIKNHTAVALDMDEMVEGATNKLFTITEEAKLTGIAPNATANDTDANLKDRGNHTGTQLASTISDFDTEVSNNTSVTANTAKVSYTDAAVDARIQLTGVGTSVANSSSNAVSSGSANSVSESGLYCLGGSVTDKPVSGGGHLVVNNNQSAANDSYMSQTFIPYAGKVFYFRTKNAGSWGNWSKIQPYLSYTVATLPSSPTQGDIAYVTDALTPTYLSTVAGSGAVVCPVFYDGTNWICR